MDNGVFQTCRYRVKDKHAKHLTKMARAVNLVWNYCNEAQKHAVHWNQKWPSGFDLMYMTAGSSKAINIPATSIGEVCKKYAKSRAQTKKPWIRFRGKRNLGWVPFRGQDVAIKEGGFQFYGKIYSLRKHHELPAGAKIKDGGSFSQDARGRWYLNVVVEVVSCGSLVIGQVGIDLGLKSLAVLSDGQTINAPRHYRTTQERLAKAQRAKKKRQARNINARIAAQRRDFLHKQSRDIVSRYGEIYVGNVNASKLAKTRMAKSVLDAGWSSFRFMLRYKTIAQGGTYAEVNENYSTQTCSDCGVISGPKGREGLVIREWQCGCGSVHDRDVNAARNILRLGLQTRLAEAA